MFFLSLKLISALYIWISKSQRFSENSLNFSQCSNTNIHCVKFTVCRSKKQNVGLKDAKERLAFEQ